MNEFDGSNKQRPDEPVLDALIREALASTSDDAEFPAEKDILAYISGRASEKQKSRVQEALAGSSEFQRFMVDLSAAIASSADTDAAVIAGTVEVPENLMRRVEAELVYRPGIFERMRARVGEWSETLTDLVRPRVAIPAVLVPVAVAVFLIFGVSDQIPTMTAYDQLLPNYFMQGTARGDEDEQGRQPHELAYQEFANKIRYDDRSGHYEILSAGSKLPPMLGTRLVVRMLDADENERAKFVTLIPEPTSGQMPDSVSFWLMSAPSLQVWQYPMDRDSVDLQWSEDFENTGCAVFTYLTVDGFHASKGITYDISN